MKLRKIAVLGAPWILVAAAALGGGCSSDEATPRTPVPPAPPTLEPDITPEEVSASFTLTVDPTNTALDAATLDPKAGPVTVEGSNDKLALRAFAKRLPARPGILWVELYFENKQSVALRDVSVEVGTLQGVDELYDFTNAPLAEPTDARTLDVGGIGPEGIGKLVIGVPDTAAATVPLTLKGTTTKRVATSSAPILVTPDGKEAWVTFGDGDLVAVIDTATDERVAEVPVAGRPTSVAVTPDGKLVLVSSANGNTVSVIDRASRKIVQTLGEDDGLGRELRNLVVTPDGGRAFVSGYVSDTITSLVRNGDRYRVEGSVSVGRRPTGMAVSPDSGTLLVAHFLPRGKIVANEGWLTVVSVADLSVAREVKIDDPLNLGAVKCLADIFGISPSRMTAEGVSSQLAGVFMNPAGTQAWTPGTRIAGATVVWEKGPNSKPLAPIVQIRPGELAAPFIYLFDTRAPEQTEHVRLPGVLDPPDVQLDYVKCADLALEIELISRDIIPSAPDQQVNRAAAFPSAITGMSESGLPHFIGFTRGGRRALVVAHMSDEIVVTDATTQHPTTQLHFALSGSLPSGLALTPDGRKAYVSYDNERFASVLDMSAYADPAALPGPSYIPYEFKTVPDFPSAQGPLTGKRLVRHIAEVPERPAIAEVSKVDLTNADPLDAKARRGRALFYSSNPDKYPTLTATRLGACATCHPGGGNDGTLWGTMEGERRTISLFGGVAGRGWLHASGTHIDAHEFAEIIVKERLGGSLSPEDTDALAEYLSRGIPRLQGPKVDAALAGKGKAVFASKCAGCHAGEAMTSGNPDATNPWGGGLESGPGLYDVGTATEDAQVILGTFFESLMPPLERQLFKELRGDRALGPDDFVQQTLDFRARPPRKAGELKAPSLVNVWDNAVFFHDGRFDKMEDAVGYLNKTLQLGMSADDSRAVVEYLKTL
jgi:YVTN family beta-propeller protein